ncbi:hypothetical protein GCM10027456_39650 [Kineosporia babensis]
MLFNFVIEGNIAQAPELRFTDSGVAVCNLRLMYNGRYRNNAGQWVDGRTVAIDLTCWRQLAERAAELNKGDTIIAEIGDDLRAESRNNYTSLRATAQNISVSMRWHPATSLREPRPTDQQSQQRPVLSEVPADGGYSTGIPQPA